MPYDDSLAYLSATEARAAMQAKTLSPVELLEALIERIEATCEDEPCLVGMSKTAGDCHSIKILAGNSIVLRRALATVRGHMSSHFPFLARNLRKSV